MVVGQLCGKRAARYPEGSSPPRCCSISTMSRRASWASASNTAWILARAIFIYLVYPLIVSQINKY